MTKSIEWNIKRDTREGREGDGIRQSWNIKNALGCFSTCPPKIPPIERGLGVMGCAVDVRYRGNGEY